MITNELVQIRLTIGVTPVQSSPYPPPSPISPPINRYFSFSEPARSLIRSFPASTPQIVCAAVGSALMATQPRGWIFPMSTVSTQAPKCCPWTKGWSNPSTGNVR